MMSRLQKVMSSIISPSQATFVHGRQILDGVLIANECIHSRHRDKMSSVLCKLDLEKAFDRVDCSFLAYLLNGGVGSRSDSSARYSILINGTPMGVFLKQKEVLFRATLFLLFCLILLVKLLVKWSPWQVKWISSQDSVSGPIITCHAQMFWSSFGS